MLLRSMIGEGDIFYLRCGESWRESHLFARARCQWPNRYCSAPSIFDQLWGLKEYVESRTIPIDSIVYWQCRSYNYCGKFHIDMFVLLKAAGEWTPQTSHRIFLIILNCLLLSWWNVYVPEVRNVHMNESKKKIYLF